MTGTEPTETEPDSRDPRDPYEPLAIFAYGSLRPGMWNDRFWKRFGGLAERARLEGAILYHLPAGFPAIVMEGDRVVHGELVACDDMVALLGGLDVLEGFKPRSPETSHFLRVRVEVVCGVGGRVPAWVYVYTSDRIVAAAGAELVPTGDWKAWLESNEPNPRGDSP